MERANIEDRPATAQIGGNSFRPGEYTDAVTICGMPDMLAAFLGGWSLGTARQLYFNMGDEVVETIMKYIE